MGTLIDLAPLAVLLAAFACWIDVGTLIDLAPLAALLAAFACWIDRRNGKRFDDLESEFRAAHERTCKHLDDLGQRIDDLKFEIRDAHEQTGRRIAAADPRTGP